MRVCRWTSLPVIFDRMQRVANERLEQHMFTNVQNSRNRDAFIGEAEIKKFSKLGSRDSTISAEV